MIHIYKINNILKEFRTIGVFKATLEICDYSIFKENEHRIRENEPDIFVKVDSNIPSFGIDKDGFQLLFVCRTVGFEKL